MRWLAFSVALLAAGESWSASCEVTQVLAADTREALRGVEDIAIDREAGIAYLSVFDRWTVKAQVGGTVSRTTQGGLYALRLSDLAEGAPARLTAAPLTRGFAAETDFHPHGIDLHVAPGGARTIFAVNHRFLRDGGGRWREENTIEIFDVREASLAHRASVAHPLIVSPNDVVAAGANAFFLTNDHGEASGLARVMEDLFRRGLGSVVAVDLSRPPAEQVRTAVAGILFPNGIALSADRRYVHVAASRDKAILTYDLLRPTLAPKKIALSFGPDNLSWGPDGKLYTAGHPSPLRFALYAKTAPWRWGLRTAPSAAARIDAVGNVEALFEDDGAKLSGASAAAATDKLVLIGTVFDDKIGVCRLGG
jgi:arylesterase/paraoxonase